MNFTVKSVTAINHPAHQNRIGGKFVAEDHQDTVKIEIEVPKESITVTSPDTAAQRRFVEAEVKKTAAKTEASENDSAGFVNPKLIKLPSEDPILNHSNFKTNAKEHMAIIFGFIVIVLGFLIMVLSFGAGLVVAIFGGLLIATTVLLNFNQR